MVRALQMAIVFVIATLISEQKADAWTNYIGVRVINNNNLFEYNSITNTDEGSRFLQTINSYQNRLQENRACDPRTLANRYDPDNRRQKRLCHNSSRPAPTNKQFITKWVPEKLNFKPGYVSGDGWDRRMVRLGLFRKERGGWTQSLGYMCQWTIDGETIESHQPCRYFETELALGDHVARVEVFRNGKLVMTTEELAFQVRDFLLVAMGDSFGSGEGNPHTYAVAQRDVDSNKYKNPKPAMWWDPRCHRSLFSSSGLTTALLADGNRDKSFSLINTACSGAETTFGLTEAYRGKLSIAQTATLWTRYTNSLIPEVYEESYFGFDPSFRAKSMINSREKPAKRDIPAQIKQLKRILDCGGMPCRKPDAIMLYMGVNDIGFSDLVVDLILNCESRGACMKENEKQINEGLKQTKKTLTSFKAKLKEAGLYPQKDNQIYIVSYPNPLTRQGSSENNFLYCNDQRIFAEGDNHPILIGSGLMKIGISKNGAKWAYEKILAPLNKTLEDLASELGWSYIDTENSMLGHGYCSDRRYFNTYWDSLDKQGKDPSDYLVNMSLCSQPNATAKDCEGKRSRALPSGTMHPNYFGHRAVSAVIIEQLRKDFDLH
nr:hypothetical protein [uncultured Cohaesibacter sp.]